MLPDISQKVPSRSTRGVLDVKSDLKSGWSIEEWGQLHHVDFGSTENCVWQKHEIGQRVGVVMK
jgi:hypothetical protein